MTEDLSVGPQSTFQMAWWQSMPALVAASFVNHVFTFGPIYTFGIFLPPIKNSLNLSLAAASSVNSTMTALQFAGSLGAGFLIPNSASHVTVSVLGSFAVLLGFTILSHAESLVLLYGSVAVAGFGLGACNLAGLTALNARVSAGRRALFVGFATCGTSVGTIVLPPVLTLLIEEMGWRSAILAYGSASAFALIVIAPCFRVRVHEASTNDSQKKSENTLRLPCRDTRFLCWWLNMMVSFLGYFAPAIMLAEFAEKELHLSANMAAMAYTAIGIGALSTRICLGLITRCLGGPLRVFVTTQAAAGIMTILLPWIAQDLVSLLVWSVVYGLCIGPLIAVISVVLSELFGTDVLPLYHGCSRTGVGLGSFCGPPLIGWLVEVASHRTAFAVAGGLVLASQSFLALLLRLSRKPSRETTATIQDDRTDSPKPTLIPRARGNTL